MKAFLKKLYRGWMRFAVILGTIMTRVLLTLVFVLVVTPIGLILRLVGKDPMHRKPDPSKETYWIRREAEANDPARMEKFY